MNQTLKIIFNEGTDKAKIDEVADTLSFVLDSLDITAVIIVEETEECEDEQA